jgi:hypothetical protein
MNDMEIALKFTDKALGVVRYPYTGPGGKKWEIAVQPNPGARIKEHQWIASGYNSSWKPWPKFRVVGGIPEEAYKKAVATIESGNF